MAMPKTASIGDWSRLLQRRCLVVLTVAALPLLSCRTEPQPVPEVADLPTACRETAARVARDLGDRFEVIQHVPFVLGGDLGRAELERWHGETIEPAAAAMAAAYFDVAPDEPITVLLFSDEETYRRQAERLFGDGQVSRFGYYRPHLRTILINTESGEGPLLHELTHALMAFDFAAVPDWFGEGLASLHERCEVPGLKGRVNWRLERLQEAIHNDRLPPLRTLIESDDFHGPAQQLNYARARYFCLYMQRQGVLRDFYRRFRFAQSSDPTGSRTIFEIFPDHTWETLDAEFRGFCERRLAGEHRSPL